MPRFETELRTYLERGSRVLKSPALAVAVSNITDKGVKLSVQAWTKGSDAGALRGALVEHILTVVQAEKASASSQIWQSVLR